MVGTANLLENFEKVKKVEKETSSLIENLGEEGIKASTSIKTPLLLTKPIEKGLRLIWKMF